MLRSLKVRQVVMAEDSFAHSVAECATSDGMVSRAFHPILGTTLFDYVTPICLAVRQSDSKAAEYVQPHAFKIFRTCQSLHGFQVGGTHSSAHFSLDSFNCN